ncbi:MAG: AraC family transcriptional regulator [Pseudomonadales bacterium]|nr:AraC family transcriptional regulator [Pseudomonadales bacterium]
MKERKQLKFPSVLFQFLDTYFETGPTIETLESFLGYLSTSEEQFRDPSYLFDGEQLFLMLDMLHKNSQEQPPAIKILRHLSITHMGMAGVAGSTAINLNDAISIATKFYKTLMPAVEIDFGSAQDNLNLEVKLIADFEHCSPILMEIILGGLKQFSEEATGKPLGLRLEFSHPVAWGDNTDDTIKLYQDYFNCEVKFDAGSPSSKIFFQEDTLDTRLKSPNKILHSVAKNIIDKELRDSSNTVTLSERARDLMIKAIENEKSLSLDDLANQLHMTPRTLSRKLAKEDIQYKALLNDVRFERAKTLIIQSELPLKQIASKLGFSSPDAFSRAFKTFTGETPNQWKSNHK